MCHAAVRVNSISIHSLRMEGDGGKMTGDIDMASFQSTPSAWRETFFGLSRDRNSPVFQSTPSAWRETVETVSGGAAGRLFQSTPSAWRETAYRFYKIRIEEHFNPLPPHGGRRGRMYCRKRCMNFNPLPPYGGRRGQDCRLYRNQYFNPLPPYGGRPKILLMKPGDNTFQSTPSVWRETYNASEYDLMWGISIHSLRMEGDPLAQRAEHNPAISIHSLRMEGDNHLPYSFPM